MSSVCVYSIESIKHKEKTGVSKVLAGIEQNIYFLRNEITSESDC